MVILDAFDNIFGGHDYNIDGHHYHTEENSLGEKNIYEDGVLISKTHNNIFEGKDFYDNNHDLIATTKSNIFGGHDLYSDDHNYIGSTHPGVDGVSYIDYNGTNLVEAHDVGNFTTIIGHSDPLAHVDNYIMAEMLL